VDPLTARDEGWAATGTRGREDARLVRIVGAVVEQPGTKGLGPARVGRQFHRRRHRQIQVHLLWHRTLRPRRLRQHSHLLDRHPCASEASRSTNQSSPCKSGAPVTGGSSPGRYRQPTIEGRTPPTPAHRCSPRPPAPCMQQQRCDPNACGERSSDVRDHRPGVAGGRLRVKLGCGAVGCGQALARRERDERDQDADSQHSADAEDRLHPHSSAATPDRAAASGRTPQLTTREAE
jgi:hypothetical protein